MEKKYEIMSFREWLKGARDMEKKYEIMSFREWGYPFICRDIVGIHSESPERKKYDNLLLAGMSEVYENTSDEEIIRFLDKAIETKSVGIMVNLSNISRYEKQKYFYDLIDKYLIKRGYENTRSYEFRTSHMLKNWRMMIE